MNNYTEVLIKMSLALFGYKALVDFIKTIVLVDRTSLLEIGIQVIVLVLVVAQLIGIKKKFKYTWAFSAIQVVMIYFLSQGTFSWLFSYLLKPFQSYQPSHSYFMSIFLLISEIMKTIWIYRRLSQMISTIKHNL